MRFRCPRAMHGDWNTTLIEAQGSTAASTDAQRSDAASGRRFATPASATEATPRLEIRARRRAAAILFGSNRGEEREIKLVLRKEEEAVQGRSRKGSGLRGREYLCEDC